MLCYYCDTDTPATHSVWTECDGTEFVCAAHVDDIVCRYCEREVTVL